MYLHVYYLKILHSAHTIYLWVCLDLRTNSKYHRTQQYVAVFATHTAWLWICKTECLYNSVEYHFYRGRSMAHAVRFRSLTEKARFRFDESPSGNCGGQGGTQTGISSITSVHFLPCLSRIAANFSQLRNGFKYRSVNLGFMLPLIQIFIWLLLFHSVSIIAPQLRSHFHIILLLPESKTENNWRLSKKYSFGSSGLWTLKIFINISGWNTWSTEH
jgi:hypothetical protein